MWKFFHPVWVIFLLLVLGQPPLGLEIFPQKIQSFHFFPFGSKKSHRVGSKNTLVSPLFIAGHKYAWVGAVWVKAQVKNL